MFSIFVIYDSSENEPRSAPVLLVFVFRCPYLSQLLVGTLQRSFQAREAIIFAMASKFPKS